MPKRLADVLPFSVGLLMFGALVIWQASHHKPKEPDMKIGAKATATGFSLPNNAATNVSLGSLDFDTSGGVFYASGSLQTPNIATIARLTAVFDFPAFANATNTKAYFYVNGVQQPFHWERTGKDQVSACLTDVFSLPANVPLQVYLFQNSGAAATVNVTFSVEF